MIEKKQKDVKESKGWPSITNNLEPEQGMIRQLVAQAKKVFLDPHLRSNDIFGQHSGYIKSGAKGMNQEWRKDISLCINNGAISFSNLFFSKKSKIRINSCWGK